MWVKLESAVASRQFTRSIEVNVAAPSVNLSDVYVFKKIAATLSFTEAARQIGVSRSAVSKQLTRLEKNLGVVLINRTTRSVSLTEAGRAFDSNTPEVDVTVERALDLVRGADQTPLGTVACALPSSLGSAILPTLVTRFAHHWPALRLNIQFDDFGKDIISNNLDLAIRVSGRLLDSTLISKRLASTRIVFAASPKYLEEEGVPAHASDLQDHRCVGIGTPVESTTNWHLRAPTGNVRIGLDLVLSANNELGLIRAACLGAGIIRVPELCIRRELVTNQLQCIEGLAEAESTGIYALYPRRNSAAKVKVLVDYIEQGLNEIALADYPARHDIAPRDLSDSQSAAKDS